MSPIDLLRERVRTYDDDGNMVAGTVQAVTGDQLSVLVDAGDRCAYVHCPHHRMWLRRTADQIQLIDD